MHGIERNHGQHESGEHDSSVRKIIVRYSDGRELTFVADASREFFSEDDILELKKVFSHAAAAAEWSEVTARANIGG
jgi:hypothetical protein